MSASSRGAGSPLRARPPAARRPAGPPSDPRYDRAVTPLLLVAAGVLAFVSAFLVLRTLGPRYRVGRLLATTPRVSVEQALVIAQRGPGRYVRVDGRIDASEEFEDHDHRPLVFRRTRLEARRARGWDAFEDRREQVPFGISEGLAAIAVDAAALDAGLVVVPRESTGVASDLADRVPPGLPAATPVRARIEQLSSVEHAVVLGVPVSNGEGPRLTAGMGRPLILTTLELPEAMRVLAGGQTTRPRIAAVLVAIGALLVVVGLGWGLLAALGVMR